MANLPHPPGGPDRVPRASPPPPRRRWLTVLAALALVGLFVVGGFWGHEAFLDRAAQHHLALAAQAQFGVQPDPARARAAYEQALQARPGLGIAHYQLGHLAMQAHTPQALAAARGHFALALQDDALPAPRQADAKRLLLELNFDGEPTAQRRALDRLAVHGPADTASAGGLVLPIEPTAAGIIEPKRRGARRVDIIAAAAQAERATLLAQRPEPSPDFLFTDGAPVVVALAQRVPPSSDVQREVATQLGSLYAADAQVRLTTASTLLLQPGLRSDLLPAAVERAEAGLLHQRGAPEVRDATRATLALLESASPLTLALHRQAAQRLVDAIGALEVAADSPPESDLRQAALRVQRRIADITRAPRPVVYIQIAHESQRPLALALAALLSEVGWITPELALVGEQAPARTEVRSQGASHQGLARWMRRLASDAVGQSADLANLRRAEPDGDVYEVWLDRDLCLLPTRQAAGCAS